jgi:hypothetical protein
MNNYNQTQDDVSCASSTELKMIENAKKLDKGYNVIYRSVVKKDGSTKRKKVEIYTSAPNGRIRNAETGEYYNYLVGSPDEALFFSVVLATGECGLRNPKGFNLLYFTSPGHYMKHMCAQITNENTITRWCEKHDARLKKRNTEKKR